VSLGQRFLVAAVLFGLLAWALFAWAKLAERRSRSGVAVTVAIVGCWAVSGAFTSLLAAAAVEGQR
jgi:hypothetical protein